jgi:YtkA-like
MNKRILILAAVALVGIGAGMARMMQQNIPADLDTASTRTSASKQFKVSYISATNPVPISKIHSWTLEVKDASGAAVDGASIEVTGKMPGHMHGMMTQPKVTKQLGQGKYLVEGVGFQMTGWWVMQFSISSKTVKDMAEFNLMLKR